MDKAKLQARIRSLIKGRPYCCDGFVNANEYIWRRSLRNSRSLKGLIVYLRFKKLVIKIIILDQYGRSSKSQIKI
jgi:hypothetical protein